MVFVVQLSKEVMKKSIPLSQATFQPVFGVHLDALFLTKKRDRKK